MLQEQRHQVVCFRCSSAFALPQLCWSFDRWSPKPRLFLRAPVSSIQAGKQVAACRSPSEAVRRPPELRSARRAKKGRQTRTKKTTQTRKHFSLANVSRHYRSSQKRQRVLA